METKILLAEAVEKAKIAGLLDYKSEYFVFLPVKSKKNEKIEAFHKSFKLGYRG